jgi:MFS family permease
MIWRFRTRKLKVLSEASAVIFLYCIGAGALWFILPSIAENLVGNLALVGLLLSIPAVAGMLFDMPLGDLCDRMDKKTLLYVAFALMFLAGVTLRGIDSTAEFVLFLVLVGVATSVVYITTATYVIEATPKKYSSSFLGTYTSFVHFGYGVGALLGGVLVADTILANTGRIGLLFSGACVTASLATFTLKKRRKGGVTKSLRVIVCDDKVFLREVSEFKKLGLAGAAIVGFTVLFTLYDGIVWALEPLLYQQIGVGSASGGLILAAFVVPLIVFEAPAGYLADKVGKKAVLAAGLLTGGVFSAFFSMSQTALGLIAYAFAATTGLALAWPALEGILAEHTRKTEAGEFVGVWITAKDLGYVLGPLAGGVLAEAAGIRTVFLAAGFVLSFSSVLVFFFGKPR